MQTTIFDDFKFWVEDFGVSCYKNHVDRNKIEDKMGMTL